MIFKFFSINIFKKLSSFCCLSFWEEDFQRVSYIISNVKIQPNPCLSTLIPGVIIWQTLLEDESSHVSVFLANWLLKKKLRILLHIFLCKNLTHHCGLTLAPCSSRSEKNKMDDLWATVSYMLKSCNLKRTKIMLVLDWLTIFPHKFCKK